MSTNNNNDEALAPAATAKPDEALAPAATAKPSHLLPPTQPLGLADNTVQTRNTGLFYINKFLSEMKPFGDDGIGSFTQVTPEHVEGDNLEKFMNGFYCWLAKTAFRTKLNTWLSTDKKMQYQKYAKQVIRERFPDHHLFSDRCIEWHNDIVKAFKRQCGRSRQLDENINEERKSQPLYPDVEGRGIPIAIRAKYLGTKIYDCRSIATNLMLNCKDLNSAAALSEFNISRAATGRGGEHALLRWDEGTFDPFYCAPDFDWPILKQLDRQCMFFFCHLSLYMICPYFGWGVYFLFGDLRRDDKEMDASKNFVYPHLHKIKRNGVAERMTKTIRSAIKEKTLKKYYTSRSMRKGQMGDARMNRDLDIIEEYAHSGHHHPTMNSNAEGYIESNPAITAPGALAAAGYKGCHMKPQPMSFHVLGEEVYDTVQRLVSEMFINDLARLQIGGNLRPVVMICAARLVGAYNDLIRDIGIDHKIVKLIREAALRARVDDLRVPDHHSGPRYHVVLKNWSQQISDNFKKANVQVSRDDPKVNEQLLRTLIMKVDQLEEALAARDERIVENIGTYSQLSVQDIDDENKLSTPKKKVRVITTSTNSLIDLDGVEDTSPITVGGITVKMELERIWKEKVLTKKSEELKKEEVLSKEVLFKRRHTGSHMHPSFKASSEMAKYDAGMTIVALAISELDWKELCLGKLNSKDAWHLFTKIEKDTMFKAIEMETQLGDKVKEGSKSTVHSLGGRLNALIRYQKKINKIFDIDKYVMDKLGAKGPKQGTVLSHFVRRRNTKK